MIKDVMLKDLAVHKDERGRLFEVLRSDEPIFKKFGQAYITVCNPNWVKTWHYHKKQDDHFCVIYGKAKIVLYDIRKNSKTYGIVNEFVLSAEKPQLLRIPKKVVHGFECIGKEECRILNLPTHLYNYKKPDEHRFLLNSDKIPYKPWKNKRGW